MEKIIESSSCLAKTLYISLSFVITLIVYHFTSKMLKNDKNNEKKEADSLVKIVLMIFCAVLIFSVTAFVLVFWTTSFYKVSFGNATISVSMEDWGAYATCLATITSFISIYWIYKTYNSQVESTKKVSFDQMFSQFLANYHAIRSRIDNSCFSNLIAHVVKHNCNESSYRTYFEQNTRCETELRSYFKFIYNEIYIIVDENLTDEANQKFVWLVQSQMNNDELLCFLINRICHFNKPKSDKEAKKEENINSFLKKYHFFSDVLNDDISIFGKMPRNEIAKKIDAEEVCI